jgi:hypothetical protein
VAIFEADKLMTETISEKAFYKFDKFPADISQFPPGLSEAIERAENFGIHWDYATDLHTGAQLRFWADGLYQLNAIGEGEDWTPCGVPFVYKIVWDKDDNYDSITSHVQAHLYSLDSLKKNLPLDLDMARMMLMYYLPDHVHEFAEEPQITYILPDWATPEFIQKKFGITHEGKTDRSNKSDLSRRTRGRQFQPLKSYVSLSTTTLFQGITRGIRNVNSWSPAVDGEPKMQFTDQGREGRYSVTSILPDIMWETIKTVPAQVIKLLHVIEAVRYESNSPDGYFTISANEITRHYYGERTSGKYKSSEKEAASKYLRAILNLELQWQWKDRKGKKHRTKGTLYNTHATDESEDLFGFVPNATVISLNRFLFDNQEGVFSQSMPYHKAFLSLDAGREAAAIFLGSFLLTKGRAQSTQFEPGECRFTNKTLLEVLVESGCINMDALKSRRHEFKIPKIVGMALDKLKEVNLIERWEVIDRDPLPLPTGSIDTIEDIEEAFPEDLPTVRRRRRISTDSGKLQGGIYAEWIKGTTRIHFTAPIEALQRQGRASAAAKKPARKGKRSPI